MYGLLYQWLADSHLGNYAALLSYVSVLLTIVFFCIVGRLVLRWILVKVIGRISRKTKYVWDDIFLKNRMFQRLANLIIPITISLLGSGLPTQTELYAKISSVAGILVFLLIVDSALDSVNEIYRLYEVSKTRPIRAVLQVVKLVVYILGAIAALAILIGESPLVLLGGIGAMTAVTSLIFKDAILGFVAGIQLTANDMIRIGDWIEMPKYSADGTVVDLSLTTVKVQNFDKTITSIPAYTLVSDAFINWRGMETSGGRRIKRAIYIDAAGVKLCDDKMLERFRKIALLQPYLDRKQEEITSYNEVHHCDMSDPVNGRRITNIGTFRAYIVEYLKQHPGIHKDMIIMVRQITPDDRGLPLEIYAFTNTVRWVDYEGIQSDIFDHLYAIAGEFGLQIYQKPSGSDLRSLGKRGEYEESKTRKDAE